MYILVFVDNINASFGPTSINDNVDVAKIGNSVAKLKKYVKDQDNDSGSFVKWTQNKADKRWIGEVVYEGDQEANVEDEPQQYYLIIEVEQLT